MDLPKFDIASLPTLDTLTGMFGSLGGTPGSDDSLIVLMTFVYELFPPNSLL